jgi:hypothetical protein
MEKFIYIKDYFPAFVSSRKSIHLLKDELVFEKGGTYVFDFTNISFISRSFADEFLAFLKEQEIKYQFENLNRNIKAILSIVEKTQQPVERDFDNIAVTFYKNRKELSGFLATL